MTTSSRSHVRISVFGLGYVGAVTAACLAQRGHEVIGVDVREEKVGLINQGRSPIVEKGIDALIREQHRSGRLSATTDAQGAVRRTDLSIICVGTPSSPTGEIETVHVEAVARDIGAALAAKPGYHVVVLRSTVLPGITRKQLVPILERTSGKAAGKDFGVCFNPEFLREASAIADFNKPPKTVIGELDARSGDVLVDLYTDLPAPVFRTTIETAEMVKYADNAWHALKISYANEIGALCKAISVDSHELMGIFCQDTKLNLSPYYLKPGFAYGGSCLPKDLRAVVAMARALKFRTPVLEAILPSNDAHLERALQVVRSTGARKVGVLGVTFKPGTDDVRESPSVRLIAALRAEGVDVVVHDENLLLSRIMGDNRQFLLDRIPDFETLVASDLDTLANMVDVLVVTQNTPAYRHLARGQRKGTIVIDLVHLDGCVPREDYQILC
jgi:GDP-mannose 6-dehydrogenase